MELLDFVPEQLDGGSSVQYQFSAVLRVWRSVTSG